MFQVLLLTVFAAIASAEDLPVLGVIGGSVATPGQFPYQVSLELNGRHHCGGTIFAVNAILTAAHCVAGKSPQSMVVLAGTNNRLIGGVRVRASQFISHEQYHPITNAYDIAIIILAEHLKLSNVISVATLPAKSEVLYENAVGIVSGWGSEYHQGPTPSTLKYARIPLWGHEYCKQFVPYLASTHMCAGDVSGQTNSCQGDSGGPLSIDGKVVGVVSAGFGCGAVYKPALYTYVASQRDWIQQKTQV